MQTEGDVIIWLAQNFCSLKAEPGDSPCVVKMCASYSGPGFGRKFREGSGSPGVLRQGPLPRRVPLHPLGNSYLLFSLLLVFGL